MIGRLSIWHRPGRKSFAALRDLGATHIVTILGEQEGAEKLIVSLKAAGFESIWIPLGKGDPDVAISMADTIQERFLEVAKALQSGGHVVVHCSAGIHRTGMLTYAFLRTIGMSSGEAEAALGELRPITQEGVMASRLAGIEPLVDELVGLPQPGAIEFVVI